VLVVTSQVVAVVLYGTLILLQQVVQVEAEQALQRQIATVFQVLPILVLVAVEMQEHLQWLAQAVQV
jgi:hypothetical protein